MSTNTQGCIELYRFYNEIGKATIDESKIKEFAAQMKTKGLAKDEVKAASYFHLFHKVATQVNEKEWLDFVETQELPPLKLSAKEMELVKGGLVFCVGIAIGAIGLGYTIARYWRAS